MRISIFCTIILVFSSIFSQEYTISIGDQIAEMDNDSRVMEFSTVNPLIKELYLNLDYKLLTGDRENTRVDEFILYLNYNIPIVEEIIISPHLGYLVTGSLDKQSINQNDTRIESNLYLGLDFIQGNSLYISPRYKLRVEYSVSSDIFIANENNISASLGSSILIKGLNFKSEAGYNYKYQYFIDENSAFNYLRELQDQGKLTFAVTSGDFRYALSLYPNGEFATASYAVFFGKLPTNRPMERIDIRTTPGIELISGQNTPGRSMVVAASPFDWQFSRIEVDLKFTYGVYNDSTYYSKVIGGVNINLFENINPYWINPFVSLGSGVQSLYRDGVNRYGVFEVATGLDLLFPQFLIKDNITYGCSLSYIYKGGFPGTKVIDDHILNCALVIAIEL